MKDAVLGTNHNADDARAILRQAGMHSFQRLAGYIPQVMPLDTPMLPPVCHPFEQGTDAMMLHFCNQRMKGCNPRVPYLLFIWLLVGSDNKYRLQQYMKDKDILRQLAMLLIAITCGSTPHTNSVQQVSELLRRAWFNLHQMSFQRRKADSAFYSVESALSMVGIFNYVIKAPAVLSALTDTVMTRLNKIYDDKARRELQQRAIAWCCMDDGVAWRIIQALMLDILTAPEGSAS